MRFFPNLTTLHRFTLELDRHQEKITCHHCGKHGQLVSHGFVYRKQHNANPKAVAKRIFCSNRHRRSGCGRTQQLYLSEVLPRLSYTTIHLFVFLASLIAGLTIHQSYQQATGSHEPRNAYRWLHKASLRLSNYRTSLQRPDLASRFPSRVKRLQLLLSTFSQLFSQSDLTNCQQFQLRYQQPFL